MKSDEPQGHIADPPVNGERGEGEEEEGGGEDGDDSDNGGDDGSDDGDDDGEIEEEAPLACVIFLGSETEDDVMLVCGCEWLTSSSKTNGGLGRGGVVEVGGGFGGESVGGWIGKGGHGGGGCSGEGGGLCGGEGGIQQELVVAMVAVGLSVVVGSAMVVDSAVVGSAAVVVGSVVVGSVAVGSARVDVDTNISPNTSTGVVQLVVVPSPDRS